MGFRFFHKFEDSCLLGILRPKFQDTSPRFTLNVNFRRHRGCSTGRAGGVRKRSFSKPTCTYTLASSSDGSLQSVTIEWGP